MRRQDKTSAKQLELPVSVVDEWLEQAEIFFGLLMWGLDPDDWTCDICGKLDDHMGSNEDPNTQLCVLCSTEERTYEEKKDAQIDD